MKVAIIGSRKRRDRDAVIAAVHGLPPGTIVVSGGCKDSTDEWAAAAARAAGLEVIEHLPDTTGCRQRFEFTKANYARNQVVADDCDRVIAFVAPDRKGGTEDTIRRAVKAGKPVSIR